jgi:hypothetical protein
MLPSNLGAAKPLPYSLTQSDLEEKSDKSDLKDELCPAGLWLLG